MADKAKDTPKYELANKEDFDKFREWCESTAGWTKQFDKETCKVWDTKNDKSEINVVKLWALIKDVKPETLYDVLHDPEYRAVWDENMLEGYNIVVLDPYNDIGYYSAKSPVAMVAGRDFCNQRSWYVDKDKGEYVIKNYSVLHPDCPEKKGIVRGWSFQTGYWVRPHKEGCTLTYITQADPRGWIPKWLTNKVTSKYAPSIIEKLAKAAKNYPDWKKDHKPENKPWLSTEPYHWEKSTSEKSKEKKKKKNKD
eukprot:TRINITY_DN537_c0_g1_i1.p1 TRINITY_DN537_c0_g1~~TRINITY_DN537_c0_g1_i1.p1  ORF type:complete len:253 (-),score=60.24 TRINITY_DN537_c0_g1_i1:4-762(-)